MNSIPESTRERARAIIGCVDDVGMSSIPESTRERAREFIGCLGHEGGGGDEWAIKDFTCFCMEGARIDELEHINTSKGTNFSRMFDACESLAAIPPLDTSNGTDFYGMFRDCSSLTSIPPLDTSNGTNFGRMFQGCSSLKDITFVGTINVKSIDLSWSKSLTKASITSLINALSSTATGQSVVISQTAVNNVFTTEEWNALKATKSNWTIYLEDN